MNSFEGLFVFNNIFIAIVFLILESHISNCAYYYNEIHVQFGMYYN